MMHPEYAINFTLNTPVSSETVNGWIRYNAQAFEAGDYQSCRERMAKHLRDLATRYNWNIESDVVVTGESEVGQWVKDRAMELLKST